MPLPTAAQVQAAAAAAADSDMGKASKTAHPVWTALVTATPDDWETVGTLLSKVDSTTWTVAALQALTDAVWYQTSLTLAATAATTTPAEEDTTQTPPDYSTLVAILAKAVPALQPHLLASLDPGFLASMLGVSEADLNKKVRLVNTQHYYKQPKYNVMAEVSEGYAKWLAFCQRQAKNIENTAAATDSDNHIPNDDISEQVMQLVGTFGLDPSRCLDMAMDILEDALATKSSSSSPLPASSLTALLKILQTLHTDKTTALVAFKLRYNCGGTTDSSKTTSTPPASLLRCVVHLLQHTDLLQWSNLLTYLPEWFDVLQSTVQARTKAERQRLKNLGKVRLSSSGGDANDKNPPTVDTTPLTQHVTTQLLVTALSSSSSEMAKTSSSSLPPSLDKLLSVLSPDVWSDVCLLLPEAVGGPLLDAVAHLIQPHLAPVWPGGSDPDKQAGDGDVEMQDATTPETSSSTTTTTTTTALLSRVATLLGYTRAAGCLATRPILLGQLWRLMARYLDEGDHVEACVDLVRDHLLPSLSSASAATTANPSLNNLAWRALSLLPCRQRYALYATWRGAGVGRQSLQSDDKPLWCIEGEVLAEKQARYDLKRLSKDTVRDTSRAIGKLSHSHPLVVFSIMLATMESYDNMIQVMVESMRFVAPLSLDVLCFCTLQRLAGTMGGVNRSRLKEDGVNVSQWLQSLETFVGSLCRQFPSLEVRGIISYLILRLRKGEVMELGVLRAILKMSAGWAFADHAQAAALAPVQLQGRAGSTMLKREIMSFGVHEDFSTEASSAIRRMMQSDNFGTTLLVLLAQVHHQIIFEGKGRPKPIKLIGNLVDLCQATTAILLDFLADSAVERSVTDGHPPVATLTLANSMPSLLELIENFELDLSSVWMICRPLIRAASYDMEKVDPSASVEIAKLAAFRVGVDVRKAYRSRLPASTWENISCDLYESFYNNTLFDIFLPDDSYKTEITRLEKEIDSKSKSKNESDVKALERMKKTMAQLSSDWNKQRHHVESVRSELRTKAGSLFVQSEVTKEAMTTFFTACIFPRCMKGPDDALYCVHFIDMLHSFETPGFGTLHLYDLIILTMSRAVFGLTEAEAANAAILLESLWKNISRWRYDEECLAEEMNGKEGCKFSGEEITSASYPSLYNKWHASLGGAMLGCLQSSEYMHCRNALVVLSRMVEEYPTRPTLANRLLSALTPLQDESYTFADIRASAQAYSIQLVRARDDGVWKEETEEAKKARKAKEKAAAAARQKKAEEQMEEMQRDSEKITEEIGERESYDQRRTSRGAPRRDRDDDRRGPPPGRRDDGGRQLDDRWQRAEAPRGDAGRGSKRSRAPSPVDAGDGGREDPGGRPGKRPRTDAEEGAVPDDSGGRRSRRGRPRRS